MKMTIGSKQAACVACGCTDSRACGGGCNWLFVDYDTLGTGVCDNCAAHVAIWTAEALRRLEDICGRTLSDAEKRQAIESLQNFEPIRSITDSLSHDSSPSP